MDRRVTRVLGARCDVVVFTRLPVAGDMADMSSACVRGNGCGFLGGDMFTSNSFLWSKMAGEHKPKTDIHSFRQIIFGD